MRLPVASIALFALICTMGEVSARKALESPQYVQVTVYVDDISSPPSWSFKLGVLDTQHGVAWANFSDSSVHPSGFGSLTVTTNTAFNDTEQMYAAGFAEGVATQARIFQHLTNMHSWALKSLGVSSGGRIPEKYVEWFAENDEWAKTNAVTNSSELWTHVGLVYSQFDGLVDGYNAAAPKGYSMSRYRFLEGNSVGDLLDLMPALSPSTIPNWDGMTDEEMVAALASRGHCSGLVRVTGNYSELMTAHSSWFTYSSMLRVAKHYDFRGLHAASAKGKKTTFSSYPGMVSRRQEACLHRNEIVDKSLQLSSLDDFYMNTESNLVMVQTTNGIMNKELYKKIVPESLLAWVRVRVANDMTDSGADWCSVIDSYNSGTRRDALGCGCADDATDVAVQERITTSTWWLTTRSSRQANSCPVGF